MSVDLAEPIRTALIGYSSITALLAAYKGSFPIFTRRPAPTDITYPIMMISPDIVVTDNDGLADYRPEQTRDVTVYGQNITAAQYVLVETAAYLVRGLFHRQRRAITVAGWSVTGIRARGPIPAPVDDDQTVARMVTLDIQLARTY